MSQNDTKPRFTRGQCRVLEKAREAGVNRTITQVCEDAGVNRRTFYRWLEKPEFAEAWDVVWRQSITRHLPSVVAAQIAKAQKGDTAAARLLADLAGLLKQHIEQNVRVKEMPTVVFELRERAEDQAPRGPGSDTEE